MSLDPFSIAAVMMGEFGPGKVRERDAAHEYMRNALGSINGPWKCESNVSLQPEALEKARAGASQSTEPVRTPTDV